MVGNTSLEINTHTHTHLVVNLNQVYQNKQALHVSAGSHFALTEYQWGTTFLISTF